MSDVPVAARLPRAVTALLVAAARGGPDFSASAAAAAAALRSPGPGQPTLVDRLMNDAPAEGDDTATVLTQLYAHGLRFSLSRAGLLEVLQSHTHLPAALATLVTEHYPEELAAPQSAGPQQALLQYTADGPLPRLTGASWALHYCLGNRSRDPPQRSSPLLVLRLTRATSSCLNMTLNSTGGNEASLTGGQSPILLALSQEQARQLLQTLKEMVAEAGKVL